MSTNSDRLEAELSLLEAMYPDTVAFTAKSQELKFAQDGATLTLRLPSTYPSNGLPEVLSASSVSHTDLRQPLKSALDLPEGEECLDSVISTFLSLCQTTQDTSTPGKQTAKHPSKTAPESSKTVIIWLHHLLATSKRKLALSPSTSGVSGLTKPGYPGIMIFTGLSSAVTEHVSELKQQNWQAFQVRYEQDDEAWVFEHGKAIKEVETMAEVAKAVNVKEGQKEAFLKATGVK